MAALGVRFSLEVKEGSVVVKSVEDTRCNKAFLKYILRYIERPRSVSSIIYYPPTPQFGSRGPWLESAKISKIGEHCKN